MFTGIVEEMGTIESVQIKENSAWLEIRAKQIMDGIRIGDSIAVNGVCLTVTAHHTYGFTVDVMHETLNRTTLKHLKCGSLVNLERAMAANGRFGGHIVTGHVDGIGEITQIRRDGIAILYQIKADSKILSYIVEKGSVTVEGTSLTVVNVTEQWFCISVIPHTAQITVLGKRKVGETVNIEADILGKYVEKLLRRTENVTSQNTITQDFLTRCGY